MDIVTYALAKKLSQSVDQQVIKSLVIEYLDTHPVSGMTEQEQIALANKAQLYKLYFDGANIFRSYEDFEEYIPMTFQEIYDMCYDEKNFVYIGDGQMKYYPQLDLNVPTKEESITFISSAQLNGNNMHTRIIINANNEVQTNQIIDASLDDLENLRNECVGFEITLEQLCEWGLIDIATDEQNYIFTSEDGEIYVL